MTATPPQRRPMVTRREIEVKDDVDVRAMLDEQVIRFLGERYSSQIIADYLRKPASSVRKVLIRGLGNRTENS